MLTTEDTEAVNDPNHHMNAALEAVAKLARKLKAERDEAREKAERYRLDANSLMLQRDEARELAQQMSESNQVLMADTRFYRNAWEQLKEAAK